MHGRQLSRKGQAKRKPQPDSRRKREQSRAREASSIQKLQKARLELELRNGLLLQPQLAASPPFKRLKRRLFSSLLHELLRNQRHPRQQAAQAERFHLLGDHP